MEMVTNHIYLFSDKKMPLSSPVLLNHFHELMESKFIIEMLLISGYGVIEAREARASLKLGLSIL
jgi:hypothetical protein